MTDTSASPASEDATYHDSTYQDIAYEVDDGIAVITLDRPDRMNAFTPQMQLDLVDAFDEADADDAVRAVVVTGRGRAFCAGADLGLGGDTFDAAAPSKAGLDGGTTARPLPKVNARRDEGGLLTLRIYDSLKPVVAAVNGSAVGVGLTMTLPMDIRIVSNKAKLGFVFARRGIVPDAAASWFLPRVVGISQALDWALSGRIFTGEEAAAAGLVKAAVDPDDVLPTAMAAAREIASTTSAVSIAITRQLMWKMLGASHPMEAHRIESRGVQFTGGTPDAREGVMSFLEKRDPEFPGRVSQDLPDFFPWWDEPRYS